ncbi:MAG: type I methionyl aminopeptidase [Candidatus Omnitrophica bacterium]|nr:type I methionyl aminopeptidase [Candidatus Omnitrophota bacterium]MCM8798074.1 type I methionyl aminopeptidase [Candidatus Omnitrophota bacterium]
MISIKSANELSLMREAGRIVARVISELTSLIKEGISTYELGERAEEIFRSCGANSAFKNYRGFPGVICVSVNEELIHGIPRREKILREGDIVSLDVGVDYRGFFADAAITLGLGKINTEAKRLIETTRGALYAGINTARANAHLGDVSYAIQTYVEERGFSVVKEFVGHGIGSKMHEEPEVPNFGIPGHGPVLKKGMTLAIEPMVNMGDPGVEILSDGWTVVSKDRSLTAHFEHTICIDDAEPIILTSL